MPHLFVYGTLRRGSENEFARRLVQFVGIANVPGRLYHLGSYPGAVPSNERVLGEVFQLDDSLLAEFDEYEGPEYQRAMVAAVLDDGRTLDCWIYWYVGSATGRPIESGDWLNP